MLFCFLALLLICIERLLQTLCVSKAEHIIAPFGICTLIKSAALAPIMMVGAFVFPVVIVVP
jgi:hypothetical protein